jgi:uncharacterized membrane protein
VKEFIIYTALRVALFLAAFAIVLGVWGLFTDSVPVVLAIIVAFAVSGVASYFMLNNARERFAVKVQGRAQRAAAKFEERKAREDVDDAEESQP